MGINALFRGFNAEAAVSAYTIVKPGASGGVVPATAATDKVLGTSDELDKAIGEVVDVAIGPVNKVKLGGTVAAGDWLTANASSLAIATTTAGHQVIGRAEIAGVAGDIVNYLRAPGQL